MQALHTKIKSHLPSVDSFLYHTSLIAVGFILLFLIVLTKSRTAADFNLEPILLIYTLAVTTFEISRLIAAMFYNNQNHNRNLSFVIPHAHEYEPTVSFVIPCMNEEGAIEKTISKCFEVDYPKEKVEVIVINDGSTDNTITILNKLKEERYPDLIIVDWKINQGKRHGMAEGFFRAKGEIVVQLDSDSYIVPSTFRAIIEPFRNPQIGAVCAHADPENADKNFLTKMQAAYYFLSFRIMKAAESTFFTVFCCSGCSSAYRKDLVLPIMNTWLNEKFLGLPVTWGDDRALTNWVLKLNKKTIYTDAAKAFTICPETLRQLMKQQVRWKKGWFVNSVFASKFIMKKHSFVALTYFFPLILVTLATPFMAVKALLYNPIVRHIAPWYYIIGVFLVALLITTYYRFLDRKNKYWPYVLAWSAINMVVLSFILFYALFTIQNRKWGTR